MANVTSGTVDIKVRNAIATITIKNLQCTVNTAMVGLSGYVGNNFYLYDKDGCGLYIDKSQLYSTKGSIQYCTWTFVIR